MHIFYTPDISGNRYVLDEPESKHCVRVLRLSAGDEVILVDGHGGYYQACIADPNPKRCAVEVTNYIESFGKRPFHLHVAIAPTKNMDRLEWFLEKATEIGLQELTPLLCSNSERKVVNDERLEKIAVSAMKQSVKAYLPKLNPMQKFSDFIRQHTDGDRFIAHCEDQDKTHLKDLLMPHRNYLVLIGPEGDFSKDEIAVALAAGYLPVSLGESRLRTETAGLVATMIANLANE